MKKIKIISIVLFVSLFFLCPAFNLYAQSPCDQVTTCSLSFGLTRFGERQCAVCNQKTDAEISDCLEKVKQKAIDSFPWGEEEILKQCKTKTMGKCDCGNGARGTCTLNPTDNNITYTEGPKWSWGPFATKGEVCFLPYQYCPYKCVKNSNDVPNPTPRAGQQIQPSTF